MTNVRNQSGLNTSHASSHPVPRISVIVCTYNRVDLLIDCLRSLSDQSLESSLYEVLVINNNSSDGTQYLAEKFAAQHENFHVFIEVEQGLSHARNRGWQEARGEYVAYIDDDAKATPEWCEKILTAFEKTIPPPAGVGGQIFPWYNTIPPRWFSDDMEIRTKGKTAHFLDATKSNIGISGSNMAFPKKVLAAYGGFDPEFGMLGDQTKMGEEAEFFHRLSKNNAAIWYDPEIIVFHWVPERNMRISYRVHRAYKAGIARARIEKRSILSFGFFKYIAAFILISGNIPFHIFRNKTYTKTVKSLQSLSFVVGSLFGSRL